MNKLILLISLCVSSNWAAPSKTSSCGAAPSINILDTLANGGIVYREGLQKLDTSYLKDLSDSVAAVFRNNKNVAVATVHGTCNPPTFKVACWPGSCFFTVSIDTILKGNDDKQNFSLSVTYGCGYDGPNFFLEGKSFLIYSDSTPFKQVTVSGPCYSQPRGFFIENGQVVSPMVAIGQRLPIQSLKKYPVGIQEHPIRIKSEANQRLYHLDGRKLISKKSGIDRSNCLINWKN